MAEVLYPTSTYVEGPLLIERKSLAQVDSILDEHWAYLVENQEQALKIQLDSELAKRKFPVKPEEIHEWRSSQEEYLRSYGKYHRRRVLTIYFADGRTLRVESFSEAFSHAEIIGEMPVNFGLRMICGDVQASIETGDYSVPRLSVSVSPSDNETARDLFGDLKGWLRTIKPSKWLEWWSKVSVISFLMWLGWFCALAVLFANSFSSTMDYKSVARQIVAKGVTSENRDQALQAILAIQADFSGSTAFHPGVGFWIFALGGFVACLILSYPPKIVIGLGKGEPRISAWNTWIKIVFVFIPLFVASNIVAPLLVDIISKKIGH